MDRRSIIKQAGIAGVLAAGVAPAVHAQAAVRWRLASSFPKSLDTIFGSAETMAKTVKAMSGGKFEITVHPAGELMPAFGVVDALQADTIDMAQSAAYYFTGKDPVFAFSCAVIAAYKVPGAESPAAPRTMISSRVSSFVVPASYSTTITGTSAMPRSVNCNQFAIAFA